MSTEARTVPWPKREGGDGDPAEGWDEVWSSRDFGVKGDGRYFAMRSGERWTLAVDPHFRGNSTLDVWLEGEGMQDGDCGWLDAEFGWPFSDWCQGVPLAQVLADFCAHLAKARPGMRVTWQVQEKSE